MLEGGLPEVFTTLLSDCQIDEAEIELLHANIAEMLSNGIPYAASGNDLRVGNGPRKQIDQRNQPGCRTSRQFLVKHHASLAHGKRSAGALDHLVVLGNGDQRVGCEDAVKRPGKAVARRVAVHELDIRPVPPSSSSTCASDHGAGKVDSYDSAGGTDRALEQRKVPSGAATQFHYAVTEAEIEEVYRPLTVHPIAEADDTGQSRDQIVRCVRGDDAAEGARVGPHAFLTNSHSIMVA